MITEILEGKGVAIMKKSKTLLVLTLCLTLVFSIVPFVSANDSLEPLVPVENIYQPPENIGSMHIYANRLHVTIRSEYNPLERTYSVDDFPEFAQYIRKIDIHKVGQDSIPDKYKDETMLNTRTLFITTTTKTRVDLVALIKLVETSPIVFKVEPKDYFDGVAYSDIVYPDGCIFGGMTSVESSCALYTLQHVVGKVEFTDRQRCYGDMDEDGVITTTDALMILQTAVGKIKSGDKAHVKWMKWIRSDTPPEVMFGEI